MSPQGFIRCGSTNLHARSGALSRILMHELHIRLRKGRRSIKAPKGCFGARSSRVRSRKALKSGCTSEAVLCWHLPRRLVCSSVVGAALLPRFIRLCGKPEQGSRLCPGSCPWPGRAAGETGFPLRREGLAPHPHPISAWGSFPAVARAPSAPGPQPGWRAVSQPPVEGTGPGTG